MSSKPLMFRTMMTCMTILACLFAAEVALSLAGYAGSISQSGLFLTSNREWSMDHWWWSFHGRDPIPTLQRLRELNKDSQGTIEIHEREFSIKKPDGFFRIIFIGDSGTYGTGVLEKNTFVHRVREALPTGNYEVINAGIPGFSPAQSFEQFRENLVYLEPDAVIYTMFLANDVLDFLEDPYIDLWNRFIPKVPHWLPFQSSATINYLRLTVAKYRYKNSGDEGQMARLNKLDENGIRLDHNSCTGRYRSYLTPLHPKVKNLWLQFTNLLKSNQSRFEELDIPFIVFILPTHSTLKGEFVYLNTDDDIPCLENAGLKYEPDKVDPELPLKNMLGLCKDLKLNCINSVPTVKQTLGLDFYLPNDDHPNEKGHRLLGEILLKNRELWDPGTTK